MAEQPKKAPPEEQINQSGRPETGGGTGRVEYTGVVPDNVRVDPDITEGHPGYNESGDSELNLPKEPPEEKR
jgi:hypothetical protein